MMRITKLHIAGFGQHQDVTIDLKNQLQVFYGLNETGKTTIQQFIMQILFGFPQKNHLDRNYEPKNSGAYGGRIFISDDQLGEYIVERTRGRAIGDVTVYMANGQQGTEELLNKLLRGYTKADIEAVFSFTLHQLQNLERMSEDELNRTLLSSGTTGVEQFSAMDKQFSKDASDLYKKTGSKPQINSHLQKIQQQEQHIKKIRERLATFEPKQRELQKLNENSDELLQLQNRQQYQLEEATQYLRLQPLMERHKIIDEQLLNNELIQFPSHGVERFNSLEKVIEEKDIERQQLQMKQSELKHLIATAIDEEQLKGLRRVNELDDEWRQWLVTEQNIEQQMKSIEQQYTVKKQLISMTTENFQETLDISSSLPSEASLNDSFNSLQRIEERSSFLENGLKEIEEDIVYKQHDNSQIIEEQQLRRSKKNPSISKQLMLSIAVGLVAIFIAFLAKQWLIGVIGVVLASGVYFYLNRLEQDKKQSSERFERERQNEKKRKQQDYKYQLSQQDSERDELLGKMRLQLEALSISGDLDSSLFSELFRTIRELQQLALQGQQLQQQLTVIQNQISERYIEVCELLNQNPPKTKLSFVIAQQLHSLEDARNRMAITHEQISTIEEQLQLVHQTLNNAEKNINELFTVASVTNKESFYQTSELFEEQKTLLAERDLLEQQLVQVKEMPSYSLQQKINLEEDIEVSKLQYKELLREAADVKADVNHLVEDDEYSKALNELEQSKAMLKDLVRKWTILQIVQEAITATLSDLQQQILPKVLQHATDNFSFLTNGKYDRLHFVDGSFEAVAIDGNQFSIGELSQATREQAYLALRFALAEEKLNKAPFPVIMDDPFVHFDTFRTGKVVQLIEKLQSNHQIIFFTCHAHMKTYFSEQNIIEVASLQTKGD